MSFYEHTIIAKHDLSSKDVDNIKNRYIEFINNSEGEIIKTEEWGLLNFVKKIKNSRKGFYIHFKFKAKPNTILELQKKTKLDTTIIRDLIVKYKKLDTEKEYFSKEAKNNEA